VPYQICKMEGQASIEIIVHHGLFTLSALNIDCIAWLMCHMVI